MQIENLKLLPSQYAEPYRSLWSKFERRAMALSKTQLKHTFTMSALAWKVEFMNRVIDFARIASSQLSLF